MTHLEIVTKRGKLPEELAQLFTEQFYHVDTRYFTIHLVDLAKSLTDYQERVLDSYLETEDILAFDYQTQ